MKAVSKALRLKVTNSKGQVSNVLSVKRIKGIILLSCEEVGLSMRGCKKVLELENPWRRISIAPLRNLSFKNLIIISLFVIEYNSPVCRKSGGTHKSSIPLCEGITDRFTLKPLFQASEYTDSSI